MTVAVTDALYRASATGHVDMHAVHDTHVRDLSQCVRALDQLAHASGVEELVASTLRQLKALRFALASTPLPGSHRNLRARGTIQAVQQSARRWERLIADSRIADAANRTLPIMEDLSAQEENPLDRKFQELLQKGESGQMAVVLKETRYEPLVSRWLETVCGIRDPAVISPSALRGREFYDTLFVFGCPRWFRNDGAGFIFDAPRAPHMHVIALAWGGLDIARSPVFPAGGRKAKEFGQSQRRIVVHGRQESVDSDLVEDLNAAAIFDVQAYLNRQRAYAPGTRGDLEYEARLVQLAGNQAVLLDWDEQASTYCIDIAAADAPETEQDSQLVCRRENRELEPGHFIILRTAGGGDLVPVLADHIMGSKAQEPRAMERTWKEKLADLRSELGENGLCRKLTEAGAIRANPPNLGNWIRERTIRPEADADFRAILRVCGLDSQEPAFAQAAAVILTAHRKAGFRIRKMLIAEVKKVNLRDLRQKGTLIFQIPELAGNASMTAYRIERIQPDPVMAQSHEIGHPFELEDELWQ